MQGRFGQKRADDGFTLFELLIVIIILAILAAIVAFSVGSSSANAATTSCQTDAKTLETALEEYSSAVGVFPGDPSLQVINASNLAPVPLSTYGQSWNISGFQLPGTYGVLGNPSTADGSWTAPNGQSVGPFMRELPTSTHYRILSDGLGGVFVYPSTGSIPKQGATMDVQSVVSVLPSAKLPDGVTPDTNSLNFETDPAICSDSNVVK